MNVHGGETDDGLEVWDDFTLFDYFQQLITQDGILLSLDVF
jgi:hypothetical protein